MTKLVKRAPPLIPQQSRGIIEAKRSQSLYTESCDRSAPRFRTRYGINGGARFTNCVIKPFYYYSQPLFSLGCDPPQGVFFNLFFVSYILSPPTCHRFVGYLEEEAVKTYTHLLHDIDTAGSEVTPDVP